MSYDLDDAGKIGFWAQLQVQKAPQEGGGLPKTQKKEICTLASQCGIFSTPKTRHLEH